MLTLLAAGHVLIGLLLIIFVLLQDPKGGAMGVFSGGSSSSSFFGSSGASNFLTTTTKWLAVLFAGSCLMLTYVTAKRTGSVMDTGLPASSSPVGQPSKEVAPGQQSVPGTNPALDGATSKPIEAAPGAPPNVPKDPAEPKK